MPLYMSRVATVVSLTQLVEDAPPQEEQEAAAEAQAVPRPMNAAGSACKPSAEAAAPAPATPAVPQQPQAGPSAPVSCIASGGTSLATYLYACGPGAVQARASLRKHNSTDCAVVPDVDDLLKLQEAEEAAR